MYSYQYRGRFLGTIEMLHVKTNNSYNISKKISLVQYSNEDKLMLIPNIVTNLIHCRSGSFGQKKNEYRIHQ